LALNGSLGAQAALQDYQIVCQCSKCVRERTGEDVDDEDASGEAAPEAAGKAAAGRDSGEDGNSNSGSGSDVD
jgi:hypothetical protein